jgi:hypothetical protein
LSNPPPAHARAHAGTYANLVRQAKSKQKILDKMEAAGLTPPVKRERTFTFSFPDCDKLPPPVLPFQAVSFAYSGKEEDMLYRVRAAPGSQTLTIHPRIHPRKPRKPRACQPAGMRADARASEVRRPGVCCAGQPPAGMHEEPYFRGVRRHRLCTWVAFADRARTP